MPLERTAGSHSVAAAAQRQRSPHLRKMMRFSAVAVALVLLGASPLQAQRPPEVRRIGYLHADLGGLPSGFYETLREGLRNLGYIEGRTLIIFAARAVSRLRGASRAGPGRRRTTTPRRTRRKRSGRNTG
jgi:hypothetical protein